MALLMLLRHNLDTKNIHSSPGSNQFNNKLQTTAYTKYEVLIVSCYGGRNHNNKDRDMHRHSVIYSNVVLGISSSCLFSFVHHLGENQNPSLLNRVERDSLFHPGMRAMR